jgi:hypothetical protein
MTVNPITDAEYHARVERLRASLDQAGLDALIA